MAKLAALGKDGDPDRYCNIDDEDFDCLSKIEWRLDEKGYFACDQGRLHQLLVETKAGQHVHHRDGDIYNNHRSNLEMLSKTDHILLEGLRWRAANPTQNVRGPGSGGHWRQLRERAARDAEKRQGDI